ncbi:hypothetical protein NEOLEDRAFT_73220 [Neolentinus lepideus HHB14362 ss-1]|uniref:Uncharacterized protein n=1 Tax=Neolentinus lepideus HHB14362 ss-1 TaxID=1314782 RepID=A0A165N2I3_9AGAM|nr:hypothetical protein NEOLEDRAFT_73220 [Neolentinus lepideus HHB14362 ss-1]
MRNTLEVTLDWLDLTVRVAGWAPPQAPTGFGHEYLGEPRTGNSSVGGEVGDAGAVVNALDPSDIAEVDMSRPSHLRRACLTNADAGAELEEVPGEEPVSPVSSSASLGILQFPVDNVVEAVRENNVDGNGEIGLGGPGKTVATVEVRPKTG